MSNTRPDSFTRIISYVVPKSRSRDDSKTRSIKNQPFPPTGRNIKRSDFHSHCGQRGSSLFIKYVKYEELHIFCKDLAEGETLKLYVTTYHLDLQESWILYP